MSTAVRQCPLSARQVYEVLVQRGQEPRLSEPLQATRVALRRLASPDPRSAKALGGGLYEAVPVGSSIQTTASG
jgi:hypothetical protein